MPLNVFTSAFHFVKLKVPSAFLMSESRLPAIFCTKRPPLERASLSSDRKYGAVMPSCVPLYMAVMLDARMLYGPKGMPGCVPTAVISGSIAAESPAAESTGGRSESGAVRVVSGTLGMESVGAVKVSAGVLVGAAALGLTVSSELQPKPTRRAITANESDLPEARKR